MSIAGKKSSQGDEYQLHVALHWLIRLLEDNSIQGIQVNSVGLRHDPLFALDVVEELTSKLEREMKPHQIWHTKPLIAALKEILSEADETDDSELIQRAINLQDRFLRLDVYG